MAIAESGRPASAEEIQVENPEHVSTGIAWVEVDGERSAEKSIVLRDDGTRHVVRVSMGVRVVVVSHLVLLEPGGGPHPPGAIGPRERTVGPAPRQPYHDGCRCPYQPYIDAPVTLP